MTRPPDSHRLEITIGRMLAAGVIVSSACLLVGLVVTVSTKGASGHLLLSTGIIALLATPAARVAASSIDSARRRDWLFFLLTLIVLAELVGSVVVARHSRP